MRHINTQMLLMVMLFYWAEQQEASCNMQSQNKGKAVHNKTSNNAIRMSLENRRYFLAAGKLNSCPKTQFLLQSFVTVCLSSGCWAPWESVFSENKKTDIFTSKSKKSCFISLRNETCFLYQYKIKKTSVNSQAV